MAMTITGLDLESIAELLKALHAFRGSGLRLNDLEIVFTDLDTGDRVTLDYEDDTVLIEFTDGALKAE